MGRFKAKELPDDVYIPFVETLFSDGATLAIGVGAQTALIGLVWSKTGNPAYLALILCLITVGIIRLVKSYGRDRLEAACGRALEIGARSFTSVNSILKNNLEAKRPAPAADGPVIAHPNIRGPRYFH